MPGREPGMSEIRFDQVDTLIVDPNKGARDGIRNILLNTGFRAVRFGYTAEDIREGFKDATPDLLICDTELTDEDMSYVVSEVRHHKLGKNPFIPVIATTWTPTKEMVRKVIESGVDDLLTKPLSTGQLMARIKTLVHARKPFVVTSDYIGPERRKRDEANPGVPAVEVPNILKAKVIGDEDIASIQQAIDMAIAEINIQKLERHAIQIGYLIELILHAYQQGEKNDELFHNIDKLLYVAEDTSRRLVGTQYDHISSLCESLVGVSSAIWKSRFNPSGKDLQLLTPLSQAIHKAFKVDAEGAALARRISESVSGGTRARGPY